MHTRSAVSDSRLAILRAALGFFALAVFTLLVGGCGGKP
jgi:hypothetical protein